MRDDRSPMQHGLAIAVHAARRARGLTERELADGAGVALASVRAIERDGYAMAVETFAKLWHFLSAHARQ